MFLIPTQNRKIGKISHRRCPDLGTRFSEWGTRFRMVYLSYPNGVPGLPNWILVLTVPGFSKGLPSFPNGIPSFPNGETRFPTDGTTF